MTTTPRFTVLYNLVNGSPWIGTGWEFFDKKEEAEQAYFRLSAAGHCPTIRPFHRNDIAHLGAVHRNDNEQKTGGEVTNQCACCGVPGIIKTNEYHPDYGLIEVSHCSACDLGYYQEPK